MKWFLAIPHYIMLVFLGIAAIVCIVLAWFAILFTGRYPRGLFDFVLGVGRWSVRERLGWAGERQESKPETLWPVRACRV